MLGTARSVLGVPADGPPAQHSPVAACRAARPQPVRQSLGPSTHVTGQDQWYVAGVAEYKGFNGATPFRPLWTSQTGTLRGWKM